MLHALPELVKPGLFITGTGTDVGKTVVSCAICKAMRKQKPDKRIGVMKPFASGCHRDGATLINEDAEALAFFSDTDQPIERVNPIRFGPPLAPAVAAEHMKQRIDWPAVGRALAATDQASDALVIERVGGAMVPLDPADPKLTVLQLAEKLNLPVLVVASASLGTLNHTAMTVRVLRDLGCRVAGIVMNSHGANAESDPSVTSNRIWIERITDVPVLAVIPTADEYDVLPAAGRIHPKILRSLADVDWWAFARRG